MKQRRSEAGFTLLEMLVAMTLLAIVLGSVAGALNLSGRAFESAASRYDAAGELALARDLLRRRVAQAFPLTTGPSGQETYLFEARAGSLAFALMEAPGPGGGGPMRAEFRIEGDPGAQRLVYRQGPLTGGDLHASTLLSGQFDLAFDYLETDGVGGARWQREWTHRRRLPALIRLSIREAGRALPAALVRLRVDADRGCVLSLGEGLCRDFVVEVE
jgi:general secretion pathway protein J